MRKSLLPSNLHVASQSGSTHSHLHIFLRVYTLRKASKLGERQYGPSPVAALNKLPSATPANVRTQSGYPFWAARSDAAICANPL